MIFNIYFPDKVVEFSPPDKRGAKSIAWLRSLISPIQYLVSKYLLDYKTGSTYPEWTAGTYATGDLVVYKQIIYESKIDGNTDTPSSINWRIYLPSFIGTDSRVLYNGQYLTLTYALNQYYSTNFNQPLLLGYSATPDADHAAYSDIYIINDTFVVVGFVVGETEPYSSSVGQTTSADAVGFNYPFQTLNNFTIYVPVALQTTSSDSEISNFVDKIIIAGTNYTIVYY